MGHTISRKSIKKIITILTAAILVLLPVGGSIREVHAEGEESSDSGMSLEHEKTVTENADGTYDLKLTVKGKSKTASLRKRRWMSSMSWTDPEVWLIRWIVTVRILGKITGKEGMRQVRQSTA